MTYEKSSGYCAVGSGTPDEFAIVLDFVFASTNLRCCLLFGMTASDHLERSQIALDGGLKASRWERLRVALLCGWRKTLEMEGEVQF